ncbi:TRAP transporter large permease [Pseudoprimorskyibacter insulae]|uniref:TRAP transporter large permease protein n=1 Tax=Pseudoprimorskyibacter insulae TaxID=1695997 RepID=A0A2R8AR04_9RHOB|nr:TRAP transporter large permease [Pseudoprimorskyibacter insulae]SPF78482.1 C4-dicarboxylate TRAP transporter large permease protein DctM [Pseudoprimorskyibacter insulae]
MSSFALGLGGIGVMLAMLFLRQPVWLALGVIGIGGNWALNGLMASKFVAGTTMFDVASNYNLSVIPLFILMGEIATGSRMSAELFNAARVMLSGLRGGLGIATLAASGAFGAICGSSVATAASMTRIAMPEMGRAGYDTGYSAATVAAGGSLGILIPPSIILVIYGSITETSVARLFAASMLPGILLMLLYVAVAMIVAGKGGAAPTERPASLRERLAALRKPWQFGLLFLLTIGGIYAGLFSPTEAASIGAFGAIVLGAWKGGLTLDGLVQAIKSSVAVSCALFMIIVGATLFSNFVVQTRLPDTLLGLAENAGMSAFMVMTLIVVIYIVLGCFLEGIGMVLITVPVFLPIVVGYGFDPIWFGVLVALLVELGLITPPVGMNLFIIRAQVPDVPMKALYSAILPFLAAPIVLIVLLFIAPAIALWLPNLLY